MHQPRNETIDAFRGVAILVVLAFHYLVRWAPPYNASDVTAHDWVYSSVFNLGALGVQLFFVISGLVIAMTLLRSRDTYAFVSNRFARLYPAFIVAATLTFLVTSLYDPFHFSVSFVDYLVNWTMMANYLGARFVDGAYWSLEVEILFYGYVAVFWMLLKTRFWLGLILLGLLGTLVGQFYPAVGYLMIAPHLPFFLYGIALWIGLFERRREAVWPGLGAIVIYAMQAPSLQTVGLPAWAPHVALLPAIALLTLFLATGWVTRWGLLSFVGRISYSLYLVHQKLGVIAIGQMNRLGFPDWLSVGLAVGGVVLLAWAMYRWVELPAGRWLRGVLASFRPRTPEAAAP